MLARLNPLRTLAGRLILVTIVAIAVSQIAAFMLFANERSLAFRREAETAMAQRIADVTERVRAAAPDAQTQTARSASNRGFRFTIVTAPGPSSRDDSAQRIERALAAQLVGTEVHASTREVAISWRQRLREMRDPSGVGAPPPGVKPPDDGSRGRRATEVSVDVALAPQRWLHARAYLPTPQPPPDYLLIGALASMLLVALGAALVSRQIGRPLVDLSQAAQRLGHGDTAVVVPVSGPEDVRRASTAFNAMAERLGRQLARQRHMLWALSHDLRTPITAMRLRAELVEDEATRQRLLGPLTEMETLTEQALALARAGASDEKRERVDLAEIARTLCGELQDIGIDARADAPTPVMAECRPSEIARAMRNLAENAAKHAGGGDVKVYRAANGETVIEVLDGGPGLQPDQLARVTEPFFRADAARSNGNGAGLGLAIVQAIADDHGGRLVLENRTPHGLSAKLILPAARGA